MAQVVVCRSLSTQARFLSRNSSRGLVMALVALEQIFLRVCSVLTCHRRYIFVTAYSVINATLALSVILTIVGSGLTLFRSQSAISMKHAMWAKIHLIQLGSSVDCLFRSWLLSSVWRAVA
jgi:hypothetical protein